jgi:hypothetical protein
MGLWIFKHAPDCYNPQTGQFDYGEYRTLTGLYNGLKKELLCAAQTFVQETNAEDMLARGYVLVTLRRDRRFVCQWVKPPQT